MYLKALWPECCVVSTVCCPENGAEPGTARGPLGRACESDRISSRFCTRPEKSTTTVQGERSPQVVVADVSSTATGVATQEGLKRLTESVVVRNNDARPYLSDER